MLSTDTYLGHPVTLLSHTVLPALPTPEDLFLLRLDQPLTHFFDGANVDASRM
jgi:hypothetical protein